VIRTRSWATALAIPALATIAFSQTPLPNRSTGQTLSPASGGLRPGASAAGPVSPIAPPTSDDSVRPGMGRIGSFAAERVSTAAATSAALVPSAARWVPVTIVNRAGGRVPSLRLSDIGVVEDGVRQRATSIERWPLWLVIVLDVGRQIGPAKQLAVHRQLVYDLLYALGEDDHVAVVQYADKIDLIQPWTAHAADAEQAVEAKFESGLEGQLWDSVAFAANDLLADKLGNRAVVVITDGVDDASRDASYDHAVDLLHTSATSLYIVNLSRYLEEAIRREAYGAKGVINVIQSPSYIGRRKELRQYADRLGEAPQKMVQATTDSGGKLWLVSPDEDPAALPALVWQQLDGRYMVSYTPERDGDPRSTRAVRAMSAFVTRGDIEARTPAKLFVPIVPPRSAPSGVHLRKH
jgi:hypothetical protein